MANLLQTALLNKLNGLPENVEAGTLTGVTASAVVGNNLVDFNVTDIIAKYVRIGSTYIYHLVMTVNNDRITFDSSTITVTVLGLPTDINITSIVSDQIQLADLDDLPFTLPDATNQFNPGLVKKSGNSVIGITGISI